MINWLRIGSGVASGILGAIILWGAYSYYFLKPTPIINNYTVQPGANLNQTQNANKGGNGASIGLVAGPLMVGSQFGGFIGGMVSFKF